MPDAPSAGSPAPLRTVEEHLSAVLAGIEPLAPVDTPLLEALDLVCAEDVASSMSLPRFDNSAMDGYAVHRADVATASGDAPVTLPVIGEIGAGQVGVTELPAGAAAKIMTGAPVPAGADAVVPYEWTDHGAETVTISQAPEESQHVRPAGEDVYEGDPIIDAGTVLGPRHLGLLASVGRSVVAVRPRPRVVIISTGSEVREVGSELGPDSIYDGNSYLLAAAVQRAGAEPVRVGVVPDDPELFLAALDEHAARGDVVITSGGISMGDFDVVKAALRPLGTVWFGGVAMQPGKPQGFGRVGPAGAEVPFVAMPGNPVSSYISFELFVRPVLRRMLGRTPESRTPLQARLTHDVGSPPGRRQFMRGHVTTGPDGPEVEPVGGPASHLVGDLAASDALIVLPESVTELAAGATVDVIRLDGDD